MKIFCRMAGAVHGLTIKRLRVMQPYENWAGLAPRMISVQRSGPDSRPPLKHYREAHSVRSQGIGLPLRSWRP